MKLSIKQYAQILYKIYEDRGDLEKNIKGFAALLRKNNDLSKIVKIFGEFENYRKNKKGLVDVFIESPFGIDSGEKSKIKEAVSKKIGKTPELKEKINPSLVAGLKIQINDLLIDTSVRTKLRNLEKIIGI